MFLNQDGEHFGKDKKFADLKNRIDYFIHKTTHHSEGIAGLQQQNNEIHPFFSRES